MIRTVIYPPTLSKNKMKIPDSETLQSELGDVGMDSWKSYLFFLTDYRLEIGLSRAKAYMSGRASHSMRCQVRS